MSEQISPLNGAKSPETYRERASLAFLNLKKLLLKLENPSEDRPKIIQGIANQLTIAMITMEEFSKLAPALDQPDLLRIRQDLDSRAKGLQVFSVNRDMTPEDVRGMNALIGDFLDIANRKQEQPAQAA